MITIFTILKIFYLYYFFKIFKTKYSVSHPYELYILRKINKKSFNHIVEKTNKPINRICPFGQQIIIVLLFYIFIRDLIFNDKKNKKCMFLNKIVFYISLVLSFLNFNAFLYLLPFWISEIIK